MNQMPTPSPKYVPHPENVADSSDRKHHEFLFGGVANTISVMFLFPLHKTIFFQQLDGLTWLQALARLRSEGFPMVYRGVLPPLLQRASSGAVMFGVQSKTERILMHHPVTVDHSPVLRKFVSAVAAGWFEASLIPFERVQTLLQNREYLSKYRHTFHALFALTLENGPLELYRGLTPVLLRNSIANGLYFCGHQWLSDMRIRRTNETAIERGLWNFAFGGLLGGIIGVITFPLNVVKTRMQSKVGGQFASVRYTIESLIYHRVSKPNISRLYRGVPANFMRSVLSWGLITMTFHSLLELNMTMVKQ